MKMQRYLTISNVLIGVALFWLGVNVLDWAVLSAVFRADAEACRGATGACWGVVTEKYRVIFFGRYPVDEQWRGLVAVLLMGGAIVWELGWGVARRQSVHLRITRWLVVMAVSLVLLKGGVLGLANVDTPRWGGLPLTLLLTLIGIAGAVPVAIELALGRTSQLPVLRLGCTAFIEIVRGVPLVAVLFMSAFLFPLFMPAGWDFPALLRVLVGIILFAAAYMAEVIRGGLVALPRGQIEAAEALGLSWWQIRRLIVLPQALRSVLPSLMNNAIALFKDTSLVIIVGLFELTGALGLAVDGDPQWRPYALDGYLFLALIYWLGCFSLSRVSRRFENTHHPNLEAHPRQT